MTSPAALPSHPVVRLVARDRDRPMRSWPQPLPERGVWRVTGPAGSGVTSLLVDTVLARIDAGVDPSTILVVAASKETGGLIRRELTDRLAGRDFVSKEPLVRSVHSLAFALLRDAADHPVRLIPGAEQDAVIRELLEGHAAEGRGAWPEEQRPALRFVGFARQLRDFLLRAAERGRSPEDLEELGQRFGRPIWTAAGGFMREYEQVMGLSAGGHHSYSASELVSWVLEEEFTGPWTTVIVDDAQHLDPTSAELIRRLIPGRELVVIGGDPEQSIFRFRGASPSFLTDLPVDHEIVLPETRRRPAREVVIVDSAAVQHTLIADRLRRAHLLAGVAYSDMAVIVRSTGQIAPLRRALLAAGVPVHLNPTDVVLAEQRIVSNILLGIRALEDSLTPSQLEDLLLGPVGGADPVTLRRLIRGLRRFDPETRGMDTLRALLRPDAELPDFDGLLTDRELSILDRMRRVLQAGREALRTGSVEEVLWSVWSETKLADHLLAASLRGGATGSQADRDLDAMMSLFDAAGDFAERRPSASVHSFLRHIEEQELPTGVRDRRTATPEAVTLLTAHGTVGGEWGHVVVAGAQEGAWPSLGATGSLFGQEELVEYLDNGVDPDVPVSHTADRLKEERRLFHVATSRARTALLITAVHAPDAEEPTEPSRFVDEFIAAHDIEVQRHAPDPDDDSAEYEPAHVRLLSVPGLLAELRRTVCDPEARSDERTQAARQLARLAAAGVPDADPEEWWTTTRASTSEPLAAVTSLSPSRIEGLLTCPLREVVGKLYDEEESPVALTRGNLTHYFLEAIGRGVEPARAAEMTEQAFAAIQEDPVWREQTARDDFSRLLERTRDWYTSAQANHEVVGVEIPLDVTVVEGVRIVGRMDLLQVDGAGGHTIVDLKTGRTAPSVAKVEEHAQLKAYQLALSRGRLEDGAVVDADAGQAGLDVAGGLLVYPNTDAVKITTRSQPAQTPEELEEFAATLPPLLAELTGPTLTARANDTCEKCPIIAICPIQSEGKLTTDA